MFGANVVAGMDAEVPDNLPDALLLGAVTSALFVAPVVWALSTYTGIPLLGPERVALLALGMTVGIGVSVLLRHGHRNLGLRRIPR